MSGRNRLGSVKASMAENEQMISLWHSLVDTLRLLPSIPSNPSSINKITDTNERERELRILNSEKKYLDESLDKLNVLLALRRGTSSSSGLPLTEGNIPSINIKGERERDRDRDQISVTTPGGVNGIKRKRKLSISNHTNSTSGSPAPGYGHGHGGYFGGNDSTLRDKDRYSSSPLPTNKGNTTTPVSREQTGKAKRERYYDQLPLQPGRKVIFKLPIPENDPSAAAIAAATANAAAGGGDDWILATIKKCIGGDKMKYEVHDDDDGNKYNTTIRSIIPLPDPNSPLHLTSNPVNLEDFPRDSQVLALYPGTTTFYRATVISPPLNGTGNGLGIIKNTNSNNNNNNNNNNKNEYLGSKKGVYRLVFVDDDNFIQEVDKNYVVAVSLTVVLF
ncbi:uncharacterized protein L201_003307 [Kwoniella dendrophila CBS 6074]|uniref:SGF29 C-terminal domain-containing protein n=1 Tax=Kwoniella dendrophila CBS 6074 TaxID=1295534 RepID=A0AAX4JSH5_9TREE